MASAAFVTEFRSFMTFESETSTQFSNLKHFNNVDHRMAPQEIPVLMNEKNLVNESQSLRNHESPISSPGTSGESSSSPLARNNGERNDINPMMVHHSSSEDSDCADECPDHLKQMEGVLEKNGILAQNLSCPYDVNDVDMDDDSLLGTHETYDLNDSRSTIPVCHFCQFAAETKDEYNKHIHSHFQFKCTQCSYMARTKGRLENHMKNHREVPENWSQYSLGHVRSSIENGNRSSGEDGSRSKKDRTTRCKTCEFVGKNKSEYYAHLRKKVCFTGPLLECEFEQCEFCTRYKHHFEYHLRNHYGSKPFKCDQCNYVCVNQSMLNSHMKSHSSQYPYRCKTCTYATKYLHSLKMHVKKYDHEPDKVLNPDGSVNHNLIIDVNGRRRGPKSKKGKSSNSGVHHGVSSSTIPPQPSHPSPPSTNYHQNPPLPSLNPSFMYNNPMFNNGAGNGYFQPPIFDPSMGFVFPPFWNMSNMKCNYPGCDYAADSTESMQQHLVSHISNRQYLYERNSNIYSRERHLTTDSIKELESRFQAAENITRTQAQKLFQSRMRESAESTRIPVPFKLPENPIAEYGVRRGFSPLSNNRDIVPFPFAGIHAEESRSPAQKDFIENREGTNNFRSSSISPPSVELARGSSRSSSSCEGADNCCSPLDLTSNISIINPKASNSLSNTFAQEKKRQNAEPVSIHPQRTTKNRRKGKAFKIDQYMQYEDQSTELSNPSLDMINYVPKDKAPEIKIEVEDLSSFSPNVNGKLQKLNIGKPESYTKFPEKSSTPTRIESSPKPSHQVQSKHFSTPKASSPVSVNGHLYRNGNNAEVSQVTGPNSYSNGYRSNVSETNIPTNLRNGHNMMNGDKSGVSKESVAISNGVSPLESSKETNPNEQEMVEKHKCPHCDIGFGDFVMLVMHMTCHSMGNPFLCAKCGADCKNRIGFMDHMINYCKRR